MGIIGVVAALTLPTLIANYQKKEVVTAFKKDYSMVVNALKMAEVEHGDMKSWTAVPVEGSSAPSSEYFLNTYLKPYLQIDKVCIPSSKDCWAATSYLSGANSGYDILGNTVTSHISFKLNNGHSIYFWVDAALTGVELYIDTNGDKKPNVLGKDVQWVSINLKKNGALNLYDGETELTRDFMMNSGTPGVCAKERVRLAGKYCGLVIIKDGWEIADDYPW